MSASVGQLVLDDALQRQLNASYTPMSVTYCRTDLPLQETADSTHQAAVPTAPAAPASHFKAVQFVDMDRVPLWLLEGAAYAVYSGQENATGLTELFARLSAMDKDVALLCADESSPGVFALMRVQDGSRVVCQTLSFSSTLAERLRRIEAALSNTSISSTHSVFLEAEQGDNFIDSYLRRRSQRSITGLGRRQEGRGEARQEQVRQDQVRQEQAGQELHSDLASSTAAGSAAPSRHPSIESEPGCLNGSFRSIPSAPVDTFSESAKLFDKYVLREFRMRSTHLPQQNYRELYSIVHRGAKFVFARQRAAGGVPTLDEVGEVVSNLLAALKCGR